MEVNLTWNDTENTVFGALVDIVIRTLPLVAARCNVRQRVRNVRRRVRRAENVRRKSYFSRAQHEYGLFFLAGQIRVDPNNRVQPTTKISKTKFLEKSTFSKHLFLHFFKKFNLDMVEKDELASTQMDLMRPYSLSTWCNPYSSHKLRHSSYGHIQSENYSI